MALASSTTARGRGRAGGRTARQTALLDDIVGLYLVEGFAHLTLDELASRLRCSKSTLYTLAASKGSSRSPRSCTSSAARPTGWSSASRAWPSHGPGSART